MRSLIQTVLLCLVAFLSSMQAQIPQTRYYKRAGLDPKVEAAIREFRASVPGIMNRGKIPGAALALVDDRGIIWTEGFGYTGDGKKTPVTPDTLFPICGLSKVFAATAVMPAVQDGLVKLDEPITTYLPDFRFNSRYEEHPERKITLRRLLNCTAGIPDTAPLGNFLDPAPSVSFEEHVMSLSGDWLVCPVGSSFYPSSASYDLAVYIASVASGKPCKDYLREKLFAPLGMSNTTADQKIIAGNTQRAIGNMIGVKKLPVLGAGNIYSTARDLGRLIQLHINRGMVDGRRIVDRPLMDIIHTPVGIINADSKVYFGQGIAVDKRWPERTKTILWHDGWTFGFLSFLHWYPEYGIGMVTLTNKTPNSVLGELSLTLTDKLVKGNLVAERSLLSEPDCVGCVGRWQSWSEHKPTPYKSEWRQYCGIHNISLSAYSLEWWIRMLIVVLRRGDYTPLINVHEKDGFLCVTESEVIASYKQRSVDEKLQEIKHGIFTTRYGDILDFTQKAPTWCNFRLEHR
jgi:CubicO group peptidase (beta-lactamase class C family)